MAQRGIALHAQRIGAEQTSAAKSYEPMRVRVWIRGADGPAHDFELLAPPRVGERICIDSSEGQDEGVVESVSWRLQVVESSALDLSLEAEPPGSVSLVQVVCRRGPAELRAGAAAAEVDESADLDVR